MHPTLAPPARTGRSGGHLAALDGVRSVAIMLVVGVHVAVATGMAAEDGVGWRMLANGGVGVSIFFVLSGLLLYRPFARAALEGTERPDVRRYLRRRALRILPAYWLMLPFVLPLFNPEEARDPLVWLRMVTLTQNYDPHPPWPMTASGLEGLGPAWSLTVEAAFYVVLPFLAAGLHRFARGEPRRLLLGLGVVGCLSLLEAVGVRYAEHFGTILGKDPFRVLFYNEHLLPRSLVFFALGMALAVLAERPPRWCGAVGASPGASWAVAACALALMSTPLATPMNGVQSAHQYLVHNLLSLVIAAAVVAPVAFAPEGPAVRALLANPPMRRLGLVSYGVFLWHMPVIELWYDLTGRPLFLRDFWLVLGVTMVFSLLLAALSYLFVEQPAQRLGRRSRRPSAGRAQQ